VRHKSADSVVRIVQWLRAMLGVEVLKTQVQELAHVGA
jgi:hypothetical protein